MQTMLDMFGTEIYELKIAGTQVVINEKNTTVKAFAPLMSTDAVARREALGYESFAGDYGCTLCRHPGEVITVQVYPFNLIDTNHSRSKMHLIRDARLAVKSGLRTTAYFFLQSYCGFQI